jgi:hypothetical protein
MPMEYWDAVKLYNFQGNFEEYCSPRKNSKDYYEVLKIQASNKQPLPTKPKKPRNKKGKPEMKTIATQTSGVSVQAGSSSSAQAKPKMVDSSAQTNKNARGAGRPVGAKNKKDAGN